MSNNLNRSQMYRMKEIHSYLQNQDDGKINYYNRKFFAEKLECSEKTISRDIENMRIEWDAPIEYDKKKYGFHYTDKTFKLPNILMTESEFFSFMISQRVLENYFGTPIYDTLKQSFDKIESVIEESIDAKENSRTIKKIKHDILSMRNNFSFINNSFTNIDYDVWNNLLESIRNKKKLEIQYKKIDDEIPSKRIIHPYHIVSYNKKFYVIAFCEKTNEKRTFSLSRILSSEVKYYEFKKPDNLNIEEEIKKNYGIFVSDKEQEVVFELYPPISKIFLEQSWNHAQILEEKKDGSLIVKMQTSELYEIKLLLFSYGKYVKILEPKSLIDDILKEYKEAINLYK